MWRDEEEPANRSFSCSEPFLSPSEVLFITIKAAPASLQLQVIMKIICSADITTLLKWGGGCHRGRMMMSQV